MPYNEKSRANLRATITSSEQAAKMGRASGVSKRKRKSALEIIDKNYDALVALLNFRGTDEEFKARVEQLPNAFLRIYGKDLADRDKARWALESIVDRIKGKPKQAVDAKVSGEVKAGFTIQLTDPALAQEMQKAMEE